MKDDAQKTATPSALTRHIAGGFEILITADTLEIQVIDYHCKRLKLTWKEIEAMRRPLKRKRSRRTVRGK